LTNIYKYYIIIIFYYYFFILSKKIDFSDDEDQINEKSNKQSLNGDIKSKSNNVKGYHSNKNANDSSMVQNLKVYNIFDLMSQYLILFWFIGGNVFTNEYQWYSLCYRLYAIL